MGNKNIEDLIGIKNVDNFPIDLKTSFLDVRVNYFLYYQVCEFSNIWFQTCINDPWGLKKIEKILLRAKRATGAREAHDAQ